MTQPIARADYERFLSLRDESKRLEESFEGLAREIAVAYYGGDFRDARIYFSKDRVDVSSHYEDGCSFRSVLLFDANWRAAVEADKDRQRRACDAMAARYAEEERRRTEAKERADYERLREKFEPKAQK